MSTKNNNKHPQIKIHGQYASEITAAGLIHRIFHYHIKINHPGQNKQQDYERDMHICEPQQNITEPDDVQPALQAPSTNTDKPIQTKTPERHHVPHPPANDAPYTNIELIQSPKVKDASINSNFFVRARKHRAQNRSVYDIHEDKVPSRCSSTALTPLSRTCAPVGEKCIYKNVLKTITIMSKEVPIKRVVEPIKTALNILRLEALLTSVKHGLAKLKHKLMSLSPDSVKQTTKPALTSPQIRNILTNNTHTYAKMAIILLSVCLMAVSLLYFFYYKTETIRTVNHVTETKTPPEIKHSKDQYHAKIEQHIDGVSITIQGPNHEEVLTKLPPGYHPIVIGNKIVHIVTPGNTLWFIAKRYIKNPYRYPELARLNKIKNPDRIYPGDRVIIQYIHQP